MQLDFEESSSFMELSDLPPFELPEDSGEDPDDVIEDFGDDDDGEDGEDGEDDGDDFDPSDEDEEVPF